MQIHKLLLKNFKQYKEAEIEFPTGLTGFVGKNGAGKSTLFEAISMAFYGKSDATKDNIKNDKAADKDPVVIELEFEDHGKSYKVKREFRGKTLSPKPVLLSDGMEICSGVTQVNKELQKILKIDYANFRNSFFAHQKDVASILNMKLSERKESFRKMLGLARLDQIEGKVKDKIMEQTQKTKGMQASLLSDEAIAEKHKQIEEKKEEIQNRKIALDAGSNKKIKAGADLASAKNKLEEAEKTKAAYDKCQNKIDLNNQKTQSTNENLDRANTRLRGLMADKQEHSKLIPKMERYEALTKELKILSQKKVKWNEKLSYEERMNSENENLTAKESELLEEKSRISAFSGIDNELTSKNELKKAHENSLNAFREVEATLNEELGRHTGEKDKFENRLEKINKLGPDSPCPECFQILGTHYDELVERYNESISEIDAIIKRLNDKKREARANIDTAEKQIKEISKQITALERKQVEYNNLLKNISRIEKEILAINKSIADFNKKIKEIGDISYDSKEHDTKEKEAESLKKDSMLCSELAGRIKTIPEVEAEIEALTKQLNQLKEDKEKLVSDLREINFDESLFNAAKKERDEKQNILNQAIEDLSIIQAEVKVKDGELKSLETTLNDDKKLRAKISDFVKETDNLTKLRDAIGVYKEKITTKELPEISRLASNMFEKITKDSYQNLRIDDKFDFLVTRDEEEAGLNTLSGGEKDLASLCIRIAVSKRISTLAGRKNMGFLALDEVFGSQDAGRREELMNALNVISKDFRQIFVVSHNEDVQEQFPNRIVIEKRSGYSAAKVE